MKMIALLVSFIMLTGGVTWAASLRCCMNRKAVTSLLGTPIRKMVNGPYERWTYEYAGDLQDELDFKYDKLVEIARWACTPTGQRVRIVDLTTCDECE